MASWMDKGTRNGAEILLTTFAVRAIKQLYWLLGGCILTSLDLQRQNVGLNRHEIH